MFDKLPNDIKFLIYNFNREDAIIKKNKNLFYNVLIELLYYDENSMKKRNNNNSILPYINFYKKLSIEYYNETSNLIINKYKFKKNKLYII